LSRRNKRRADSTPASAAGDPNLPDPDVLAVIVRVLNGELDGPDLVALHAATQRRIEELLAPPRPPFPYS
jgi:hypothetical protein